MSRDLDPSMKWQWAPPSYMPGVRRVEGVCALAYATRPDQWGKWDKDSPIGPPWLLDEGFAFPYGCDEEIKLRAWRLGFKVGVVSESVVGTAFNRGAPRCGIAAHSQMYNAIRLAGLYMSPAVIESVLLHYHTTAGVRWVVSHLMTKYHLLAARRQKLDEMGPSEMANLTPVLREFCGLDAGVNEDRSLMLPETPEEAKRDS